jgi:hypothetical protein
MNTPPLRQKLTYRRRLTPKSIYSVKAYAALTAETLWAWNRFHSSLLQLFAALLGKETSSAEASAIWHTLQSDRAQRELLLSVAKITLAKASRTFKQIEWMIRAADKIAAYRNAVVHVPIYFREEGRNPHSIILDRETARDRSLILLETAGSRSRFWNALSGDLFVLAQFAGAITDRVGKSVERQTMTLARPKLLGPVYIRSIEQRIRDMSSRRPPKRPREAKIKIKESDALRAFSPPRHRRPHAELGAHHRPCVRNASSIAANCSGSRGYSPGMSGCLQSRM